MSPSNFYRHRRVDDFISNRFSCLLLFWNTILSKSDNEKEKSSRQGALNAYQTDNKHVWMYVCRYVPWYDRTTQHLTHSTLHSTRCARLSEWTCERFGEQVSAHIIIPQLLVRIRSATGAGWCVCFCCCPCTCTSIDCVLLAFWANFMRRYFLDNQF